MKNRHLPLIAILLILAVSAHADPSPTPQPTPYNGPKDTRRHDKFVEIAKAGNVDVVFFGDSITDFWRNTGKAEWAKYMAPLKAANFGISGDITRNVLWRVNNGELDKMHPPKLVVLLIGTNNMNQSPEYISGSIKEIIEAIQSKAPGTRILLLGIFPRGGFREKTAAVNKTISTYAFPDDPKRVIYMDIGQKFLNADGTINKELMPDTLHLSPKGFEVWAEAIIGTVQQQLK